MAKKTCILLLIVIIVFIALPIAVGRAEVLTEPAPGDFITAFRDVLDAIGDRLIKQAKSLFICLAIIQFVYNMGMLIIRGQMDMNAFATTLLRQIMLIGIFYLLLDQAPDIFNKIIQSFQIAATGETSIAGEATDAIDPGKIYACGLVVTDTLSAVAWKKASILTSIGVSNNGIGYGLAMYISLISTIILLAFAVMTAVYALSIIKWYFVCTAGMLFLGFGGSEWSSDIAKNTFKSVLSIGAEIFVILLIANVATTVTESWIQQIKNANTAAQLGTIGSAMAAMAFIVAVLTLTAPGLASGLISGSAIGSGGTGAVAGMAAGAAGMAARGAAGAVVGGYKGASGGSGVVGKIKGAVKGAIKGAAKSATRNSVTP